MYPDALIYNLHFNAQNFPTRAFRAVNIKINRKFSEVGERMKIKKETVTGKRHSAA